MHHTVPPRSPSAPLATLGPRRSALPQPDSPGTGIHKIKHVIIIMQENRSFDSYFGTYPGADGIPMSNGVPTVCVPNPRGGCQQPYHDKADINGGAPHGYSNFVTDLNGGRMDGFIRARDSAKGRSQCHVIDDPGCPYHGS